MSAENSQPDGSIPPAAAESSVALSQSNNTSIVGPRPPVLAFSTKGSGSNDEDRLRGLLSAHDAVFFPFDFSHKLRSFRWLFRTIRLERPELVVMEGTGIAGGFALILSRMFYGVPYAFSSGDAIGPYIRSRSLLAHPAFAVYERVLCRLATGFIGWTPYLVGRALTFGCRRAMTAAGWSLVQADTAQLAAARSRVRQQFGFSDSDIVFGIVGSLFWSDRLGYAYGKELVEAARRTDRPEIKVLIVGGGTGLERLRVLAGDRLNKTIFIPGPVPLSEVLDHLAALDVGSLPQSVDALGSFRYTTKVSEYLSAHLPLVTGQIPFAYDLGGDWMWRLPGRLPWGERYINALATLMRAVTPEQIREKRESIPALREFDRDEQFRRAGDFIADILEESRARRAGLADPASGASHVYPDPGRTQRVARPGKRRLLSVAHSYAVGQNRRLVDEMTKVGGDKWEIAAVAPQYFHGRNDLRPVEFERMPSESSRIEVLPAHFTGHVHFFFYGRRLKQILREGWDMVHCWEEPYIIAGGQVARWTPRDVPLVYRTAQSLIKRYPPPFNWLEQMNMRRASGWICSGTLVAQTLQRKPIYRDRPMRLIPLGVDMDFFKPDTDAGHACRRELGWDPAGPPVVGYLGRFVPEKGLHILMRALSDLKTPWRAIFVGAGPAEQQLRDWAENFPNRVRVCTDVRHNDVPRYLNAMDVMAAPSQTTPKWREQFGRMLVEAFASGVTVVGSDSGEIPFVIDDCGIVCAEADAACWTRSLEAILSQPERRRELAAHGIQRARDKFAWPVVAQSYLDFFEELVEPRVFTPPMSHPFA